MSDNEQVVVSTVLQPLMFMEHYYSSTNPIISTSNVIEGDDNQLLVLIVLLGMLSR